MLPVGRQKGPRKPWTQKITLELIASSSSFSPTLTTSEAPKPFRPQKNRVEEDLVQLVVILGVEPAHNYFF